MKNLVTERKSSKIRNWQREGVIKYFLLKNIYDKYKILISEQVNDKDTDLEINKSFDDKVLSIEKKFSAKALSYKFSHLDIDVLIL